MIEQGILREFFGTRLECFYKTSLRRTLVLNKYISRCNLPGTG